MSSAEEAFNSCSGDGEGLTRQQTYTALCMCNKNPTGSEIASYFVECGIDPEDAEGKITLSQFEELASRASLEEPTVEGLTAAFQHFDTNGDGTIDREELQKILTMVEDTTGIETDLDEGTIDALWNAIDTDGSGSLSYAELAQYVVDHGTILPSA